MADLNDTIETAAEDPESVSVDGQAVSSRPLPDLIEADKHLARKAAGTSRALPIRFGKIRPPGAV
jgi:hypothetical protein